MALVHRKREKEHGLALKLLEVQCEGEPTQQELKDWAKLGMLPPGQGGRTRTKRQCKTWAVHNVVRDATAFEKHLVERVQRWTPNHDWIPRGPADGRRFF